MYISDAEVEISGSESVDDQNMASSSPGKVHASCRLLRLMLGLQIPPVSSAAQIKVCLW